METMDLKSKLENLGLTYIYDYVMEHNPSKGLPYHSNYHLEQVTKFALIGSEYYKFPIPNQRLVAVAALFHDFDHSGSGKEDNINIMRACKGFIDFNNFENKEKFEDEEEMTILNMIKETRFPYLKDGSGLNIMEQVLRDSDILQGVFSEDYINRIVLGIAQEANLTPEKMLAGQAGFLNSAKFCTEWATELYKVGLPSALEKVEKAKLEYDKV